MNKEQLLKTLQLTREYNEDLHKQLRSADRILKGKAKTKDSLSIEQIQEILISVSILLSGNIKARYELEEFVKSNRSFMDLGTIKNITNNCKMDIEALRSISFSMVEVLKSMKMKQDEEAYKEAVV